MDALETTGVRATGNGTTKNLGLLIALLVALATLGIGPRPASADGTSVPITGTYSGTAVADFEHGIFTFSGTGNSTHLGHGTNTGQAVVTGQVADTSCFGGVAFQNTNTETFTAANGDTITITATDVACPISEFVFHGTGHWVVTGGTGRFSDATGEGTIDGGADFAQGVFNFHYSGSISNG